MATAVLVAGGLFATAPAADAISIEDLFIVDRLFDNNGTGGSDIGELVVLDSLFGGSGVLSGDRVVRVESGDTLSGIAQSFLGDASRFRDIAELNNLANPNFIRTGQTLRLPENGILGGGSLGDLIILDALFGD